MYHSGPAKSDLRTEQSGWRRGICFRDVYQVELIDYPGGTKWGGADFDIQAIENIGGDKIVHLGGAGCELPEGKRRKILQKLSPTFRTSKTHPSVHFPFSLLFAGLFFTIFILTFPGPLCRSVNGSSPGLGPISAL